MRTKLLLQFLTVINISFLLNLIPVQCQEVKKNDKNDHLLVIYKCGIAGILTIYQLSKPEPKEIHGNQL